MTSTDREPGTAPRSLGDRTVSVGTSARKASEALVEAVGGLVNHTIERVLLGEKRVTSAAEGKRLLAGEVNLEVRADKIQRVIVAAVPVVRIAARGARFTKVPWVMIASSVLTTGIAVRTGVRELQVLASLVAYRLEQTANAPADPALVRKLTIALYLDPKRTPDLTDDRLRLVRLSRRWVLSGAFGRSTSRKAAKALDAAERLDVAALDADWQRIADHARVSSRVQSMPKEGVSTRSKLERGRRSYAERSWLDAYTWLTEADGERPLGAGDLERLATSAYLVGQDDDFLRLLERAVRAYLADRDRPAAVRCAFWLSIHLLIRGDAGRANGWLARAGRLVSHDELDCLERGYLASASAFHHLLAGRWEEARADAARAAELGERHGDRDLVSIALIDEGRALAALGRVHDGLVRLDEAMVGLTAGELSPIVTGLVYCGVIEGCHEVYELRRAAEWTEALTRWCDEQTDLVPFTGTCMLHRAELMQLQGGWPGALEEARRAGERFAERADRSAAAQASYREGEVLRLQGKRAAAERAYREASRLGHEPQPGLALLRLAQGDSAAAAAAIRTVTAETTDPLRRAALLPAHVEVMLAAGDVEAARSACHELEALAARSESRMLDALAAHARGSVALAAGDGEKALAALRHAAQEWRALEVPYECARARVLVGLACRALGDGDTSRLELEAARAVFAELGAAHDLARVNSLAAGVESHGLTRRELEVLRLVASGETNKAIAAQLVLSERTVDRHVSNIFTKLRVSSRTAAAAYAYEHRLA